jgi:Potassium-transporting ATPase A subunit
LIFAIPSALTYTLGRMTGSQRHGWAVWAAMAFLFLAGVTTAYWAEGQGNPQLVGVDQTSSASQSGGNMEGKEVRFGIANSALFATVTTDASCGEMFWQGRRLDKEEPPHVLRRKLLIGLSIHRQRRSDVHETNLFEALGKVEAQPMCDTSTPIVAPTRSCSCPK